MADTIERIYKLTVDGTQAARGISEIARATESMDKRIANTAAGITKFAGALAAVVSVGTIVSGIKSMIDSFDQLGKDAQKVGIAAEELQRLRYAADLSGVGAEQLDQSIGRLAVNMAGLEDSSTDAARALRALGAQSGDSTIQTLQKISDQFQKMPDGIAKTALAIQLFGKGGAALIPMLNEGGEALKKLTEQADRFGGVVDGKTIAAASAFNDSMSNVQRTLAGVGAQITSGMLIALQTLGTTLEDTAKTGDGFVSTGKVIGEVLLDIVGVTIKSIATLSAFASLLKGIKEIAFGAPGEIRAAYRTMMADIDKIDKDANEKLKALRDNYEKYKNAPPPAPKASGEDPVAAAERAAAATKKAAEDAKKLAAANRAAAKAADDHRQAENARWKELVRVAEIEERATKAADEREVVLSTQEKRVLREITIYKELNGEVELWLDNIEDEGRRLQILTDWLEEGTDAQKAYAKAKLEVATVKPVPADDIKKAKDELDVLNEGFEDFFENMARGTADVEELFKRMVASIIAELLKVWAKRYIIDALTKAFGGGGGAAAATTGGRTGLAFDAGEVVPFARGGVLTRPVMFPMALAGEAGPEAIMPLRRTASGDLGVQAQQPQLQVTINNNAPNTQVDTRMTPGGLEVIVSHVKASLTADILRGGNDFATANEKAWGLSRGSAASF